MVLAMSAFQRYATCLCSGDVAAHSTPSLPIHTFINSHSFFFSLPSIWAMGIVPFTFILIHKFKPKSFPSPSPYPSSISIVHIYVHSGAGDPRRFSSIGSSLFFVVSAVYHLDECAGENAWSSKAER